MLAQPTPADLKALANMPGAGRAHREVRKKFDPDFGIYAEGDEWIVSLECDASVIQTIETVAYLEVRVRAGSEEEARHEAVKLAKKTGAGAWDLDESGEDEEISKSTVRVTSAIPPAR